MANQRLNITIAAIDKTKSAFGTVGKSLKLVTGALFSFKTAIAGAVGVGGLGLLVNNSLRSIDALGKTADKLGVTTEALGAMRYAAEITGVATRTTDMAMQRFTRRLSEAAAGTGEAKGALIELGINARQLAQLPLDEQMLALSDAFTNVQSQSDRVRLAFKLFDSEGVALVSTLSKGRDELAAMFAEADSLGILLSQSAADGVEDANDALLRLSRLFGGITDQIVAALAPALESFATVLKDTIVVSIKDANGSVQRFGETIARSLLGTLSSALRGFADFIDGVTRFVNAIIEAANAVQRFRGATEFSKIQLSALSNNARDAATFIDGLADSIGKVTESQRENIGSTQEQITVFDRLRTALDNVRGNAKTVQQIFDEGMEKAISGTTEALHGIVTGAQTASQAFSSMARSILNDLLKMYIRRKLVEPLFGGMMSFLPGGSTATPTPKAIGGSVQAGRPYMVGERGAELFVPNRSGSIVPNREVGGTGSTNVVVNVNTEAGTATTNDANKLGILIGNVVKAEMVKQKRPGGLLAAGA